MAVGNQLIQLAFGSDGIQQFQTGKFVLARAGGVRRGNIVEHPIVQRAMRFKFERAQRMGDAFDGIGNGVGVVVHRVDTPFVAGIVVMHTADAVNHRIAHVYVAGSHVDFQAQGFAAVGEFAVFHAHEEVEVFFNAALAVRAVFARLGKRAAVFAHFFGAQIIYIGFAVFNQADGVVEQTVEIIGSIARRTRPLETQPAHVFFN